MIEPRIYRAAFLPALFALVLVAFSLASPPHALEQGPAADVLFEGTTVIDRVRSLVRAAPDRRAGGPGDRATAASVASSFRGSGFSTSVDRFDDDGRQLVNVVGRRAGESTRAVLVVAARDSDRPPDAPGSAADTAALMEFARVFEGRLLGRTLILASVDGGALGDAGVRRLVDRLGDRSDVEAAIVMSDLGAKRSRGPLVLGWSNGTERTGIGLERTVTASLREEVASVPAQDGTLAQFARLSFPIAPGGQGVLLDSGLDAIRVSGAGETALGGGQLGDVEVERYGELGRAVLRMIGTLDASKREPARGPRSYLTLGGMVLPAWVLQLLAITLALPALIASVDALARARRHREAVAPWIAWLAASIAPFALAIVLAWVLALAGLIDDAPPAPLDPRVVELDSGATGALIAVVLAAGLGWALGRTRLARRAGLAGDATARGAASASALVLSAFTLAIAFVNPFAALVLVPAAHLWMLATLTRAGPRASVALAVVGLLPLLAVVAYYMWRLDLPPPRAAYYLLLLVTGNQTGLPTTVVLCVLLGVTLSVATILVARVRAGVGPPEPGERVADEPQQSIFGPGGHAGPGMLGGTESSRVRR